MSPEPHDVHNAPRCALAQTPSAHRATMSVPDLPDARGALTLGMRARAKADYGAGRGQYPDLR
jgi:hypothetical protein